MSRERQKLETDEQRVWRMPSGETASETPRSFEPEGARDTADATAPSSEPAYLPHDIKAEADERWQRIQAEFVDDPRGSVTSAHALVSELVQRVVDTFTTERDALERQWSGGADVSTEDLRICMQRYRSFFSRLLPLNERSDMH